MKKAAVIGDPISHSLSPKLHNFWLKKYAISGNYEAIQVRPENLADAVKSMIESGYAGFNVTIPHKEKIFELAKNQNWIISAAAAETKAVNTVIIKDNLVMATNSDCDGFFLNLIYSQPNIKLANKNAFLIGAGGAARAIIHSLITDLKVKNIFITNRSKNKFDIIAEELNQRKIATNLIFLSQDHFENELQNCDILINSTSLGMQGQSAMQLDLTKLNSKAIVYDIVYKPLYTNLLKQAQNQGNPIVTGIGMLAYQAAIGFEKWFEKKPEIDEELLNYLIKISN